MLYFHALIRAANGIHSSPIGSDRRGEAGRPLPLRRWIRDYDIRPEREGARTVKPGILIRIFGLIVGLITATWAGSAAWSSVQNDLINLKTKAKKHKKYERVHRSLRRGVDRMLLLQEVQMRSRGIRIPPDRSHEREILNRYDAENDQGGGE